MDTQGRSCDPQAKILITLSEQAADEGNLALAEDLMNQAEELVVTMVWEGESN